MALGTDVAVVGCGAVSTLYYAPALMRLRRRGVVGRITAFDPDAGRAHTFAELADGKTVGSFDELLELGAGLVIVASPPMLHVAQSIAALEAGMDVLCEKPLAIGAAQAQAMIDAAKRTGTRLFAGYVRRQFPATKAIADFLRSGLLGEITGVTCFEGGPFAWPVAGPSYFSRASSGGGVLQDIGTHCFDLLHWWFGAPDRCDYQDDAFGGVEANCVARLDYGSFQATMRLSRDWAQPNVYRIVGSGGWLAWQVNDPVNYEFQMFGNAPAKVSMTVSDGDDFHQAFVRQIEGALHGGTDGSEVTSVPASVSLIERCYADRVSMRLPWLAPAEAASAESLAEGSR